ncbi:MAG: pyrimidine-nucleoside phosphorylase [Hungatella hathewayi]|uniref:pyrimidine-nucleoside phosphorylase n=1 Tax=Hungatella TaxID=1649459 RepID=UPI001105A65F|nr:MULTISPECIES: pyrimidine-nucleoside phosphorylase [Hungatella]MCI7384336.1 pyrimidine-nucleoside phosphorylase [Hungatella sp.]MDY6235371.1 pyrimidine-nucleoside phosphorylase [Hungatella hathewayi]
MRMYDVIMKKRDGGVLTDEEIGYFVDGYTKGEIPDYQASALLMAIFFQGMNEHETAYLTGCMAASGDEIDLSSIPGIKVDKHSTGGVGDKTTMVIGPVAAACGVPVAKLSGRGLGHTGGTLDKLEAIPGLTTSLDTAKFFDMVKEIGIAVAGQTGNLAPADKKLYALRDVTATVDNISLIAASIMSKKIASGSDRILLDVKTGSGAFMKTLDDSIALAKEMVNIGTNVGREVVALVTDMDRPLGRNIGNALEVMEAAATLKGRGPEDFTQICLALSSNMLYLAEKGTMEECTAMAKEAIKSGRAFEKFCQMAEAQGGDASYIRRPEKFTISSVEYELKAEKNGYITAMDTEKIGMAAVELGAGRRKKEDPIDYGAGIILNAKIGDRVENGQTVAVLYTSAVPLLSGAVELLKEAVVIGKEQPEEEKLICARVTKDGVERY